jgi:steroid 5-alpha reductase family enzyme
MDDRHADYTAQRIALVCSVALWVVLTWWLLFYGGLGIIGASFGRAWSSGNILRRDCLGAAFAIYCIRLVFTTFVFLKRHITFGEVSVVSLWVLLIFMVMAIAGGTNPAPIGPTAILGIALFLFGSWMNSFSEYQRHRWKQQPGNRGKLYTHGLFHFSRHPNYLGDVILFSGLALIAGAWLTTIIPAIMLAGFVFANIPKLDAHLHDHYGDAFDEYARHTPKLIPFLY